MAMQNNECAMGQFPVRGNAATDSPEITRQFAPRGSIHTNDGVRFAYCHGCDQLTMIKDNPPRKGYFAFHKSSQKGYKPFGSKKSGTPARVRGRKQS